MHAKDAEGLDMKESELTRRTEAGTLPRNLITERVGFLRTHCSVANSVLLLPITTLAFFPHQSHSSPFFCRMLITCRGVTAASNDSVFFSPRVGW